jgi:hypothetical protein
MRKPIYQRFLEWAIFLLIGYSLVGAFLDATSNAISLVRPSLSIPFATAVLQRFQVECSG